MTPMKKDTNQQNQLSTESAEPAEQEKMLSSEENFSAETQRSTESEALLEEVATSDIPEFMEPAPFSDQRESQQATLSLTAKYMIYGIAGQFVAFLLLGLGIIFFVKRFEEPLPFALGLFLSCIVSGVKVVMLERSIATAVDKESGDARNYAQGQYLVRLALTIGSFLLAVFIPTVFGLFGVIVGFFTLQFSAYIANVLLKRKGYPVD